jgi:hypothetical protein
MRGPSLQCGLKHFMIAVAIGALLSALGESYQGFHRAYWQGVAMMHAAREWECQELALGRVNPREKQAYGQQAADHARLKARYTSIASHPWSPIAPELSAPGLIHD